MFTDEFRRSVEGGKYTQWANYLSPDQLLGLLWAMGEYRARPTSHRSAQHLLEEWMMADSHIHPRARAGLLMALDFASGKSRTKEEVIQGIRSAMGLP
jgi:hypothetical protein